jgi:tetratricopeptide (TPR) repeat protein
VNMGATRGLILAEGAAFATVLAARLAFAPEFRATFPVLAAGEALGTRLSALTKSASALVFLTPFDRTICDAFPVTELTAPTALAGAMFALTLLHFAWTRRASFSMFALALLPSLSLVPLSRFWSPHYLYLPLAFGAFIAAELLEAIPRARPLLYVALPALALVSFTDAFRFRSDASLFTREVAMQPSCREGHFYLGEVARKERRFADARGHYERALAPDRRVLAYVDRKAALANLGVTHLELGTPVEARAAFLEALNLAGDHGESRRLRHNAALAALLAGDAELAVRELETEVSRSDALAESVSIHRAALSELAKR